MDNVKLVLLVGLVLSVSLNGYLYSYWFDHEYPHGEKGIWADQVVFFTDSYGYVDYVTIGSETFEWGDFDVKAAVYECLGGWRNFSYEVVFDSDPYHPTETIVITDHREPSFGVTYHTYDAMFECSEGTYKQKVIDSIRIGGWVSSEKPASWEEKKDE